VVLGSAVSVQIAKSDFLSAIFINKAVQKNSKIKTKPSLSFIYFIGFLTLLFSIFVVTPISAQTTWHVAKDCTGIPNCNTTIQAAINAAFEGDIIIVHPGTYNEKLTINKANLTIQSSDGETVTIVDGGGSGAVVSINATGVKIEGFWFKNANTGIVMGDLGEIRNCKITDWSGGYGLSLFVAWGNLIKGCTISNGGMFGVYLQSWSNNNTFEDNDISDTLFGFYFDQGNNNNTLIRNNIHNNSWGGVCGVLADTGLGVSNTIQYNNIYSNTNYGIYNTGNQVINATLNWWGDPSGPNDPNGTTEVPPCNFNPADDLNADGTGDKVTNNVDYCPWLSEQYAPTKCVETATGSGIACFGSDSGVIESLTAIAENTLPAAGKPNLTFPHGFFSFQIKGLTPCQTVIVTITLPSSLPIGTQYWKYCASEGGWIQIPMGGDDGDNLITITLVDGGLGDEDGVCNGVIVDQGGPGFLIAPPIPVPALTQGGMIILFLLLPASYIWMLRKRGFFAIISLKRAFRWCVTTLVLKQVHGAAAQGGDAETWG